MEVLEYPAAPAPGPQHHHPGLRGQVHGGGAYSPLPPPRAGPAGGAAGAGQEPLPRGGDPRPPLLAPTGCWPTGRTYRHTAASAPTAEGQSGRFSRWPRSGNPAAVAAAPR